MIQRITQYALLLLLLAPGLALAEEVKDLYTADITVEDKTSDTRQEALRDAMATILIRVSGRSDVMLNPMIQKALAKPQDYALTYQYLYLQSGSRGRTLVLRVALSERNINALLRDAKLPIWGKSRPGMLLWLAVDNGKQRILLGATNDNWISDTVHDSARERGLPVQLPLLDAQDQGQIQLSDIWGGFSDRIAAASQRYQDDAVLVGRVYLDNDAHIWHARWTLMLRGNSVSWEVQGRRLASIMDQGMSESAERIAYDYAYVQSDETRSVYLHIKNINSLDDMVQVQNYLTSQVGITEAQPIQVKSGEVFFRLTLDGRWTIIAQSIALGNKLTEQVPPPADPNGTTAEGQSGIPQDLIYHYRYLP